MSTELTKEIEYGVEVENANDLIPMLKDMASDYEKIYIKREIYKNEGKYFVKASKEEGSQKERYVFSLKEDLLKQGQKDGLKIAEEIDIPVSREQLENLIKAVQMLGFRKTSEFSKVRDEFQINSLVVTLDQYDKKAYLEVEGPTKEKVMLLVEKLPIDST